MPTPAPAAGLVPQQAWDGYASLPPEPEPPRARSSRRSRGRSWRAGGRCIGRAAAAKLVGARLAGGRRRAVRDAVLDAAQRDGDQPPLPAARGGEDVPLGPRRLELARRPAGVGEQPRLFARGADAVRRAVDGHPPLRPVDGGARDAVAHHHAALRLAQAKPAVPRRRNPHRLGHARAPRVDGEDGARRPLVPLQGAVDPHRPLHPGAPRQELGGDAPRQAPGHLQGRQPQAGDGARRRADGGALLLPEGVLHPREPALVPRARRARRRRRRRRPLRRRREGRAALPGAPARAALAAEY